MNHQKVKLMVKIAMEDKKFIRHGRGVIGIGLLDYLFINCFYSFLAYTASFFLILLAYVFAGFNQIMDIFMKTELKTVFSVVVALYLLGLTVYLLIAVVYYRHKYAKNRKFLTINNRRITMLKRNYYKQEDGRTAQKKHEK